MAPSFLLRRFGPFALAFLAVMAAGGASGRATPPQPQQQPPPPQFRATTDLVLLDVSVLDKNRRPIKGLTQADFTILEDGVPQQLANFTAVELPDAEVLPAKWMGRAAFDVQSNRMPDGRLVLIYLDERMVNSSPFATKSSKETAHAIVDQLSPSDVAAVGFVLDHKGAQEFTTDRARLHTAVDSFSASGWVPVSVLGTLRELSQLLGGIPERRKIIVYIGPGQGYDIEVLAGLEKVTTRTDASATFGRIEQRNQYDSLMSLIRVANRANVAIYTVDPNGLDDSSPSSPAKEFLRLVSNSTGARAVIANNVPASQVPTILGENASYYLMAFRSSNPRNEGKFRRVEVKVNRPGAEVRARRGYVEGRPGATNVAGVNPALGRLIPATQLALGLWAAPAGSDPSGSHAVAMMIDVELPFQGAPRSEHLAVAYSIVDMSGKERASGKQELTVSPPPNAAGAVSYFAGIKAVANLPPGKYDIRVSAQSIERGRRGGLLGDVVVPDFSKDGLSASGVFVGEIATGIAATGDPLSRFLAVTPTTDRTFTPASPIVAAMRLYQAKQPAAPVTIKVTVLDTKDKAVFEAVERLEAAPFTTAGFADYRFALPLAKVGPGQFLLRLEASRSGAPAVKREVRFSVK